MGRKKDLTGKVFGHLHVVALTTSPDTKRRWWCVCECGKDKVVRGAELTRTSNPVRSCGCLQKQTATTHGMSKSVEYRIWRGMWNRCTNQKLQSYANYGARGITVCERWKDFERFLADMGKRPRGASLERNDNDGAYEPDNCRWATLKEQGRNKRNSRRLTLAGRTQTLIAWAEELGISKSTLGMRLATGWSTHRALTTPVAKKRSTL